MLDTFGAPGFWRIRRMYLCIILSAAEGNNDVHVSTPFPEHFIQDPDFLSRIVKFTARTGGLDTRLFKDRESISPGFVSVSQIDSITCIPVRLELVVLGRPKVNIFRRRFIFRRRGIRYFSRVLHSTRFVAPLLTICRICLRRDKPDSPKPSLSTMRLHNLRLQPPSLDCPFLTA